ncbi:hypothetical protein BGZ61DRAFT_487091 [Ilyonectria robusta]|uniref:uncharacterized protein n=1 Tax=Ilyonectria robusta TaxID=1079257 RepID=UPI001E8E892B|nr:uncharacterized protein BGZ61DRAFT_487091 [Ilyonectria robusta]KAH8654359.1 hypothetical protein BGZ61DRAFT_487091 [Ilyonectria robusta]
MFESLTIMEQHHRYNDVDAVPFKSIKLIGGGAVGVVDEVLGLAGPFRNRVYARKTIVLVEDPAGREAELLEIEKEVEILREASHHHIVKLVTTYLFDDNYAIVMDPRADSHLERSLQQNARSGRKDIHLVWVSFERSGLRPPTWNSTPGYQASQHSRQGWNNSSERFWDLYDGTRNHGSNNNSWET